ncbi:MAG: DUF2225 domain-containing protein [Spirochaetaceae bacterium]|jgi:uncharacterized protein (DUF2225 family)|nr:DUF2225 domain-containing protein [Spirochaetaceae bacterium]
MASFRTAKKQNKKEDGVLKISFYSKEEITCPICNTNFRREELLTGSGRQIAGSLTDELHRLYETSAKYGDVYPLAYQSMVCPSCWFAAQPEDFLKAPEEKIDKLLETREARKTDTALIFPPVDFTENRNLISGAVSQYLTLVCYDYFTPEFSPAIKQGMAALRTAWLLDEMEKKYPQQHYDWLSVLFKKKARFFYQQALKRETTGQEPLAGLKLGPDTDQNYGYEGVLYIAACLEYKYGEQNDQELRRKNLDELGRNVAKMFGLGKSSKGKPGPLLEKSKALYDLIKKELKEFDG